MTEVSFTLTGEELPNEEWILEKLGQLFAEIHGNWKLEIDEVVIYKEEE